MMAACDSPPRPLLGRIGRGYSSPSPSVGTEMHMSNYRLITYVDSRYVDGGTGRRGQAVYCAGYSAHAILNQCMVLFWFIL